MIVDWWHINSQVRFDDSVALTWHIFPGRYLIDLGYAASWYDAKGACAAIGGHLPTVQTRTQMNEITSLVVNSVTRIWVGGNDEVSEGSFRWESGEPFNVDASLWGSGQPDNFNGENCIEIVLTTVDYINDENCFNTRHVVCERKNGWNEYVFEQKHISWRMSSPMLFVEF